MKKALVIVLMITTFVFVLVGCELGPKPYAFRQTVNEVAEIEICQLTVDDEIIPLKSLNQNEISAIWTDIKALDCEYSLIDYPRTYGPLIIRITYKDGSGEILGCMNTGHFEKDGEWHFTCYSFKSADLHGMLEKYVDPEVLYS